MFYASDGSCGGYRHGMWTAPARCPAAPVAAGLAFYEKPRPVVIWAFACPEHVEHLIAPRPLLERDRAEMARRRELSARHEPDPVGPLAVGRAARELLDRARRWAHAHPDLTYTAAAPAGVDAAAPPTSPGRPFDGYASSSSAGSGVAPPGAGQQGR